LPRHRRARIFTPCVVSSAWCCLSLSHPATPISGRADDTRNGSRTIDVMKVDKRYKLHVEYDPQLEIPIAIDIDSFANGVDAKVGIRVTEFNAQ
jgi:hypothetical protein